MASSAIDGNKQLLAAFDRCLAMQADHLTCLQAGSLTKIALWLEERQAMVACLRQELADAQTSELDDELRALLLERLRCILDTEKVLFTFATQQRSALAEKLTVIRRGKRTLGRYGSTVKNQPPQFVSDQG